jgi:hypothetical protein
LGVPIISYQQAQKKKPDSPSSTAGSADNNNNNNNKTFIRRLLQKASERQIQERLIKKIYTMREIYKNIQF